MKTYTATLEKRPIKLAVLLAKFKAFRQTPAWVKTRRFFWAIGVVLLDAFATLLSGAAAANDATNIKSESLDSGPVHKDRFTGQWMDGKGRPCNPPVNPYRE